jgi:CoA:oxalate CoA-transferase
LVKAMVSKFDVLVENFAPGVMARMGLDYPALKAVNPALIMCSISMAGQTGPLAEKSGFDVIGQAYAGVTDLVGEPDRPPAVLPMAIGDISTGVASALAVAVALIDRMRTGEGQHIDASLVDTYFHMHAHDVPMISLRGDRYHPKREGSQSTVYPPGVFRANGGYIAVMAPAHQWSQFIKAIGMPELKDGPRFKDYRSRMKNNAALREIVEQWLARQPSVDAAVEILGKAHIPCAPVLELRDAMRHPQLVGRKTVRRVHDPGLGDFDIPGMPIKFSAWPDRTALKAPRLGEHNEEVLREVLGLSDKEVAGLYAEEVLVKYQPPT